MFTISCRNEEDKDEGHGNGVIGGISWAFDDIMMQGDDEFEGELNGDTGYRNRSTSEVHTSIYLSSINTIKDHNG